MTQDEIIELARQSGFLINELHCSPPILSFVGQEESMQSFAKLVADKATAIEQVEKQEPVAWIVDHEKGVIAPQRTWVGLTDDGLYAAAEIAWRAGWAACRDAEFVGEEAEDEAWGYQGATVARAIESKLKQKNGY